MRPISPGYEDASKGFSDEKLDRLCQQSLRERGLTPWAAWESESTSFGKTFRKWARYPAFLPLCFTSEHGVNWGSRCMPNEVNSPYKIFFTWNKKKTAAMQYQHGKSAYHVPHPWVFYRKTYWGNPPPARSGTLVFYPHSNGESDPVFNNLDAYIDSLIRLPEIYHPISICMSFHDIEKKTHKKIRKYGIPIVTAGAGSSRNFVDRFYSLIYQFRYATSPNIGSHTYYTLEAGIPFFLYGDDPAYIMRGSEAVPDGLMNLEDYGDAADIERFTALRLLLSQQLDTVSDEQRSLVSEYLGLDSNISRNHASKILYYALISNPSKLIQLYADNFRRLLKRLY